MQEIGYSSIDITIPNCNGYNDEVLSNDEIIYYVNNSADGDDGSSWENAFGGEWAIDDALCELADNGDREGIIYVADGKYSGIQAKVEHALKYNVTFIGQGINTILFDISSPIYGITHLDIFSNFINVTGYASKHSWALVAGIEVQDSDDRIMNNTIIVDTVNAFEKGFNVYGISYSQTTKGDHNYNIQYNNVSTNSDYAVALKGGGSSTVSDSIVANNILNGRKYGGNRAVYVTGGTGNVVVNNTDGSKPVRKMTADEYSNGLKNYLKSPFKGNGLGLGWLNNGGNSLNPGNNGNGNNNIFGNNPNDSNSQARNGDLNSTHYTYGSSGVNIAGASSSSGSGAGSSQSESSDAKSYEVTKKIDDDVNHIQVVSMIVIALILLIIGYRRKEHKEEY